MNDPRDPGHPIEAEVDDSPNPTTAAPDGGAGDDASAGHDGNPAGAEPRVDTAPEAEGASRSQDGLRDMLTQLQAMIDDVAEQAGPVLREVAAKAAELAAVAGERAGPLAVKAAEKTQAYGERFAARSKEMAAELRRQQASAGATEGEPPAGEEPSAAPDAEGATQR